MPLIDVVSSRRKAAVRRLLFGSHVLVIFWVAAVGLSSGCAPAKKPHAREFLVPEPSGVEPVTAAMGINRLKVQAGESFDVLVRVRIAGGYHIYAPAAGSSPFTRAVVRLDLPGPLEAEGEWIMPRPTVTKSGESIYTDSVLFRRRIKVRLNAPNEPVSIKGELLCQACDAELCRPPGKIPLSASVKVVSR